MKPSPANNATESIKISGSKYLILLPILSFFGRRSVTVSLGLDGKGDITDRKMKDKINDKMKIVAHCQRHQRVQYRGILSSVAIFVLCGCVDSRKTAIVSFPRYIITLVCNYRSQTHIITLFVLSSLITENIVFELVLGIFLCYFIAFIL